MGKQIPIKTKSNGARTGGVTRAASLGAPLSGPSASANNARGNGQMNKGGTRPITVGTKSNGARTGTVTKGVVA